MNPRTESHIHYVRNGWEPWDGPVPYMIDVAARFVNGHTMTSARLLGDAFDCYTWWDDADRSINYDCRKAAQLHEDLEAVMNRSSPKLEGTKFVPPPSDEMFHMYPTTCRAYVAVIEMANRYLGILRQSTARDMEIDYEPQHDRVRVWHHEQNRTFAYLKPIFRTLPGIEFDFLIW